MRTRWLVCGMCGKTDKTTPGHVGTSQEMRCDHCGGRELLNGREVDAPATRCRDCCPTGHHTRYRDPIVPGERSLNDVLRELELSTRATGLQGLGVKAIVDGQRVVYVGTADEVWKWLRATKRVQEYAP